MKKLIMMMAMAVGVTVFADSQNDKLISFSTSGTSYYQDGLTKVVDNECFALVWIKDGESFDGFNADGTLKDEVNNKLVRVVNFAQDGHCPPITFVIPAGQVETDYAGGSFAVYLLDTRDANGQPAVAQNNKVERVNWFSACDNVGAEVDAAEDVAEIFGSYVCRYADGKPVFEGERCLLISSTADGAFRGLRWNGELVDKTGNAIVGTFVADASGKFTIDLGDKIQPNMNYELIVLDSRRPDGSKREEGLVGAFGEFMLSADGTAIDGIRWNAVRMGFDATFYKSGKVFEFDPTKYLEKGYAAVSDGNGWKIYELPKAYAEIVDNGVVSSSDGYAMLCDPRDVNPTVELGDPFTLDVTYRFMAFKEDIRKVVNAISPLLPKDEWGCANFKDMDAVNAAAAQAVLKGDITEAEASAAGEFMMRVMPFWGWNCDFEVSFDRPIKKGTYVLGGHYDQAKAFGFNGWVCSAFENDLVPGESVRLLKDNNYKGVYVTYYEICSRVQEFLCGVINLSPENYGTTMTVKLCIYDNQGRDNESGSKIVIGTYDYTFCGPLGFQFRKGADHPENVGLPYPDTLAEDAIGPYTSLQTNHNGKMSFVLPALQSGVETLAFVGWSNAVDSTIMTYVPTNTWGSYNLYSTWKTAKTIEIQPDTNKTANVASIKVADEWIEENLKGVSEDKVAETLQKPAEDGGKIPLWQTYVLGLNPSGTVTVVATEKLSEDKALVVSTVEAPAPDAGFKVTYSLDKIDKTTEKPIDDEHKGKEQDTKDLSIDLEPQGGETPTGYYKMNVIITPEKNDVKEEEKVYVKSEVTVGVLTVKTEEPVVPVAIPWTSLAGNGDDANAKIPADEIVQPQGLADGDLLHVYNGDAYTTLVLKNGKWTKGNNVIVGESGSEVLDGEIPSVARGSAMWLERKTNTGKPFHLFGQYNKTDATTKINKPADGSTKPEYNLIAPTGIEETDLNEVINHDVVPEDRLMIVKKGSPVYYSFKNGKWGYNRQKITTSASGKTVIRTERVEDAKVSAGLGLWYISEGGEPEINWNK